MSCGTHLNFEVNFKNMSSDNYLKVVFLDGLNDDETNRRNYKHRVTPFANSEIYFAPVLSAEKLTKGEDVKRVFKLSFDVKDINYEFSPGDTIGILPENSQIYVEKLLIRLNIESVADSQCMIEILKETTKRNPTIPKHLPKKSTLRSIFINHVDIFTPPKKLFLKSLANFVKDPQERAKLDLICAPKSSEEYKGLLKSTSCSLLGLLDAFPSCQPPVEIILEHLPPLQPRAYSISSSPLLNDKLDVTFFVLERDDGRKGTCTGWLESLIENNSTKPIPFYFRQPNKFQLSEDPAVPLILVATGTGIAPFRAFLQHRSMSDSKTGPVWLFYGCRYADRDYLYKEEIEEYLKRKVLSKLNLAFSREQAQRCYVQDNIDRHGHTFIKWLLKEDATMFVCGNVKTVVSDIKDTLVRNLVEYGGMDHSNAEYFVCELESRKKLIFDSWT